MDDSNSGTPPRVPIHVTWHKRLLLGVIFWVFLLATIPFLTHDPAWRWTFGVVMTGLAAIIATYSQQYPPIRDAMPVIVDSRGILEDLSFRAVERADKTLVTWLTITGAAHSALFAVLASGDKVALMLDGPGRATALGAGLLLLGLVCYAASRTIAATRDQANRALEVACRNGPLSRFFQFVYRDDESVPWRDRLVAAVGQLGYCWIWAGLILTVIGYILQVAQQVRNA